MIRCGLMNDDGSLIDDAMVCEMHSPISYTGEDVVEFFTHGSSPVIQGLTGACKKLGARDVQPGGAPSEHSISGRLTLAWVSI